MILQYSDLSTEELRYYLELAEKSKSKTDPTDKKLIRKYDKHIDKIKMHIEETKYFAKK